MPPRQPHSVKCDCPGSDQVVVSIGCLHLIGLESSLLQCVAPLRPVLAILVRYFDTGILRYILFGRVERHCFLFASAVCSISSRIAACSRGAAVQQRGMRHAACTRAASFSRNRRGWRHGSWRACSTTGGIRAAARPQGSMKRRCKPMTQIHADRRRDGQRLVGTSLRQDGGPDTICVHPRESAFICVQILSGSHNSSRKKRRTALPDPPPYTLSCRRTTRSTPWMSLGPSSPMRRRSRNTLTVVI